jgi:uncharacterized membrane-anchored protein
MSFTEHPLRRWAVDEMRLRRFAPVGPSCEIYQVVRLIEAEARSAEDDWLLHKRPDFDDWYLAARHGAGHAKSGLHFLWERHTEASTLTLIFADDMGLEARGPYIRWMEEWPGAVVRATRIRVIPDISDSEATLDAMRISRNDLVCCDINAGLRIWSDFAIHADGYGRLLVTAGDVEPGERGRIIQRAQELGNYRNLALLGFPKIQEYGPKLDVLEAKLSEHAGRVASNEEDDDALLNQLAALSSELELVRSATSFRLSATAAYADVAADRLAALNIQPVDNYQSLTDFTERRLIPASRTCAVFRKRLDDISARISAVMHTLDVRIDSRIKAQNLQLMQSMERSTQLQVRLQSLVEGLSVLASAYYLIGLIGYMLKGADSWGGTTWSNGVIGAITLPIIIAIYWMGRRVRSRLFQDEITKKT